MSTLAVDSNGDAAQCLRPSTVYKVASTGTASNVTAIATGISVVRLVADAAVNVSFVGTATAASTYLPAGTVEYFKAYGGDVISVIGTANLYVTEMV